MPYQTITLSSASVPGASDVAVLSWRAGQPTSVAVYGSTTGTQTGVFSLQYTMDDIQLVGGSSAALWASVSSAIGSSGTTFLSSTTATNNGLFYQFLTPIAALRLSSTALSSGPMIMKVIQGEP